METPWTGALLKLCKSPLKRLETLLLSTWRKPLNAFWTSWILPQIFTKMLRKALKCIETTLKPFWNPLKLSLSLQGLKYLKPRRTSLKPSDAIQKRLESSPKSLWYLFEVRLNPFETLHDFMIPWGIPLKSFRTLSLNRYLVFFFKSMKSHRESYHKPLREPS